MMMADNEDDVKDDENKEVDIDGLGEDWDSDDEESEKMFGDDEDEEE